MKEKEIEDFIDDEVIKNFQDRCDSQTAHKLTDEDKKIIKERWKEIEECGKKYYGD